MTSSSINNSYSPGESYIPRRIGSPLVSRFVCTVCRWTCTRVCTRMLMRIIVQTFLSSNNETVTKTRQDISHIRGTSIFLRTEAKGVSWCRLSVTICARMLYDTFVFNFWFYCLWWCIYYHWYLYFNQKEILCSCTVVFLRMSVSFTMYLVRDDLINKWNQSNQIMYYSAPANF